MMHQESTAWANPGVIAREYPPGTLSMLAYRSRAVVPPTQAELDHILRSAKERNRTEGLTGLLIYDQGCFFQWLEGPYQGLMRVWESIRRDPRHREIEILREEAMSKRSFGAWPMRLSRRTRGEIDSVLATVEVPRELLKRLRHRNSVLDAEVWDSLFAEVVVSRLELRHPAPYSDTRLTGVDSQAAGATSSGAIWHAGREAGAELAGILLGLDTGETARYVNGLIGQGAALEPLYTEVFEPAARCLGGLWDEDLCDDFNVTLAMGRLQIEVRRLSTVFARKDYAMRPGRAVLVAPQPGERHRLNAAMGSEMFWRHGWDVSCEFPSSNNVLRNLVREQWFDVLELSLSGALRRDQQLQAMEVTIRAAQEASLNPALVVIVDGRSFFERPQAYLDVGADGACRTSTEVVSAAHRALDAMAPYIESIQGLDDSRKLGCGSPATTPITRFARRFRSTVF